MRIAIILSCAAMFYYVIWRFFVIFHHNSKIIPLIIAILLASFLIGTFIYQGKSKILDIIGTLSSRVLVLGFLLTIILAIEHIISIRYKINPRIIVGIILLILCFGAYFALITKITRFNIKSDKISQDTKIIFVSDIHVDNIISKIHLRKLVRTIKDEAPDFVIIGGDLINKPNSDYIKYYSIFDNIDTPIYAVMGNHDVMGDSSVINLLAQNSKIRFLFNDSIKIGGIQLIGIIDKSIRGNSSLAENINKTNYDNNSELFNIFISHQPIALEKLKDYPIDLELAGHTHRGQFIGIRGLVYLLNDYGYGKYNEGNQTVFVSQGIGTRGLPFRLGTQSEIVIIDLES